MAVPICARYAKLYVRSKRCHMAAIRISSQNDEMSVLIISCGLMLLSGNTVWQLRPRPHLRTPSSPRALEEFKPLTGLDNTPRGGTLPGGTLPGGTLPGRAQRYLFRWNFCLEAPFRAAQCPAEQSQAARSPEEHYQEGRYLEAMWAARWQVDHCSSQVPLMPKQVHGNGPRGSRR